ncbi:MAG: hypothetical protein AABZ74_01540 [Cyanobacteriota bacterium]
MASVRMLQAARELAEKEKMKIQGTLKARRNQESDTKDVGDKTNKDEIARTVKKAQSDTKTAKAELDLATKKEAIANKQKVLGAIGTAVSAVLTVVKFAADAKKEIKEAKKEKLQEKTKELGGLQKQETGLKSEKAGTQKEKAGAEKEKAGLEKEKKGLDPVKDKGKIAEIDKKIAVADTKIKGADTKIAAIDGKLAQNAAAQTSVKGEIAQLKLDLGAGDTSKLEKEGNNLKKEKSGLEKEKKSLDPTKDKDKIESIDKKIGEVGKKIEENTNAQTNVKNEGESLKKDVVAGENIDKTNKTDVDAGKEEVKKGGTTAPVKKDDEAAVIPGGDVTTQQQGNTGVPGQPQQQVANGGDVTTQQQGNTGVTPSPEGGGASKADTDALLSRAENGSLQDGDKEKLEKLGVKVDGNGKIDGTTLELAREKAKDPGIDIRAEGGPALQNGDEEKVAAIDGKLDILGKQEGENKADRDLLKKAKNSPEKLTAEDKQKLEKLGVKIDSKTGKADIGSINKAEAHLDKESLAITKLSNELKTERNDVIKNGFGNGSIAYAAKNIKFGGLIGGIIRGVNGIKDSFADKNSTGDKRLDEVAKTRLSETEQNGVKNGDLKFNANTRGAVNTKDLDTRLTSTDNTVKNAAIQDLKKLDPGERNKVLNSIAKQEGGGEKVAAILSSQGSAPSVDKSKIDNLNLVTTNGKFDIGKYEKLDPKQQAGVREALGLRDDTAITKENAPSLTENFASAVKNAPDQASKDALASVTGADGKFDIGKYEALGKVEGGKEKQEAVRSALGLLKDTQISDDPAKEGAINGAAASQKLAAANPNGVKASVLEQVTGGKNSDLLARANDPKLSADDRTKLEGLGVKFEKQNDGTFKANQTSIDQAKAKDGTAGKFNIEQYYGLSKGDQAAVREALGFGGAKDSKEYTGADIKEGATSTDSGFEEISSGNADLANTRLQAVNEAQGKPQDNFSAAEVADYIVNSQSASWADRKLGNGLSEDDAAKIMKGLDPSAPGSAGNTRDDQVLQEIAKRDPALAQKILETSTGQSLNISSGTKGFVGDKSAEIGGAKGDGPSGLNAAILFLNLSNPAIQMYLQALSKIAEAQEQKLEATKKLAAAQKLINTLKGDLQRLEGSGDSAGGIQAGGTGIGAAARG